MSDSLRALSLLFMTQLIFTMYGAGLRRPFASLETIKEAPDWIRARKGLVLAADLLVVAFLCFMWYRLIMMLDLGVFLVGFFVFAAIGTLLAHRINLFNSSVASFAGILVAIYLILHNGSLAQIGQ